ncbi:MAG: glycosyltransferase family 4 protein [Chloroflexi bacterium]|nr:glycosyltransferase family 4 protein [Chloroflexota bacterium]
MRIGIDQRLLAFGPGGIAEYALELLRALAPVAPQHELIGLGHRRGTRPPLPGRVRWTRLWTPPHHRLEQVSLIGELALLRLDLVHQPDFIPLFHRPGPSVITVHDLAFLKFPGILTAESQRYYGRVDRAVQRASRVIADSESTRRDVIELLNADPVKVRAIPLAAGSQYRPIPIQEARTTVAHELGLTRPYVLFVGTIEPRKNLPLLLRAWDRIVQTGVNAELAIVGRRGWLAEQTEEAAAQMKHPESVRWLGVASREHLPALYAAATALALPSLYEGFGLPALEAMSCGTPAVVSDVSSLPEVVGAAGIRLDPDDEAGWIQALTRLIEEREWRDEVAARCLAQSRSFSWPRTAAATLAVYEEAARA